jgi:hypothetical protein
MDLTYGTRPHLGLDWTLRHRTSLETGLDLPYNTGPHWRQDWTFLRTQDFAQDMTWLETEQDLAKDRASIGTGLCVFTIQLMQVTSL